jgi:hypothetical protein
MDSPFIAVNWLFCTVVMMMVMVHVHLSHLVFGAMPAGRFMLRAFMMRSMASLLVLLVRFGTTALTAGAAFLGFRFVWFTCH